MSSFKKATYTSIWSLLQPYYYCRLCALTNARHKSTNRSGILVDVDIARLQRLKTSSRRATRALISLQRLLPVLLHILLHILLPVLFHVRKFSLQVHDLFLEFDDVTTRSVPVSQQPIDHLETRLVHPPVLGGAFSLPVSRHQEVFVNQRSKSIKLFLFCNLTGRLYVLGFC